MEDQESRFLLAGEEDAFREKAGNLFSALNGVQYSPADDVDGFLKNDPLRDGGNTIVGSSRGRQQGRNRSSTAHGHRSRHERIGSSLMPPPRAPTFKRKPGRAIPGHVISPSKYTKYTLADVPDQQMSQKSNTAAALAFLQEIDQQRNKDNMEDDVPLGTKPVFKRPSNKAASGTSKGDRHSSTMSPECNDGSIPSQIEKPKHKSKKEKEIKLSHLEYEDE